MGCADSAWIQRLRRRGGYRSRFRAFWRRTFTSDGTTPPQEIVSTQTQETQKLKGDYSYASTAYASAANASIASTAALTSRSSSNSLVSMAEPEEAVTPSSGIVSLESKDERRQEEEVQQFDLVQGGSVELISALTATYTALVAVGVKKEGRVVSRFHGIRAPAVPIDAYLARLRKYFDCSDSCLVTALIYIDRIVKLHPTFTICQRTIHRLVATSMMLSAKFNDDIYYSNAYYAKVCGLTLKEINALECEFLKLLSWKLDVSTQEYEMYRDGVLSASHVSHRR